MKITLSHKILTGLILGSLAAPAFAAQSYILIDMGEHAKNLEKAVKTAGGTLEASYPFGVSVATSDNPGFASGIPDSIKVVPDYGFDVERTDLEVADEAGFPPNSGDDDDRFDFQWGHNYVGAQQAWAAGYRGQGVRVAVIDGGFDLDHPDLQPNINLALSMDFTGEGLQYSLGDVFSHGSHTAGTIAAADNGIGTIGVAPEAELVLLKALSDAGSGSFADIIEAVYYAAEVDADVVNMSLGTIIPRTVDPVGVTQLDIAVSQAIQYATQQGTTVIVSAGNAASNLDGDRDNVRFNETAEASIPISAWTTLNWAGDPDAPYVPASYTNYGTSGVDFAAPGGSGDYPGNEICQVSTRVLPCWVFDLVYSTGNGGWYWSAGTSMAAPHAAGVAALIISENGGSMHPAQVKAEMRKRAIDLGKPGRDDFAGMGNVHSGHE